MPDERYVIDVLVLKMYYEAVVAQWIRPRTLNCEVPGSNLLAAAIVPLGKALYPHCLVPRKGLKSRWSHGCLLISSLLS